MAAAHGLDHVSLMTFENHAYENGDQDGITRLPTSASSENGDQDNVPSTNSSDKTEHRAPAGWDTTPTSHDKHRDSSSELEDWDLLYKIIRVIVCSLFFCLVLLTATSSKLSLLMMVSNIHVSRDVDVVFRNPKGTNLTESTSELVINVNWIWALLCVMILPYIFTILSCLWRMLTMNLGKLHLPSLILALIPEVLHAGGLTLFIFYVLPSFDPITGLILTVSVGTVPGILKIVQPVGCRCGDGDCHSSCINKSCSLRLWNTLMFLLHSGVITCLTYRIYVVRQSVLLACLVPISLVLISISYWDNFVPKLSQHHGQNTPTNDVRGTHTNTSVPPATRTNHSGRGASSNFRCLSWVKTEVGKRATRAHMCISMFKVCVTLLLASVYFNHGSVECWRTFFFVKTRGSGCTFNADVTLVNESLSLPWMVAAISVVSSAVCYKISKYACKILAQELCFAVPLLLSFPATLCALGYAVLHADYVNKVMGTTLIENYFHANDLLTVVTSYTYVYWIPIGITSIIYLVFGIGLHIWTPKCNRMTPTSRLFQKPLYCGVLLDSSLILNRNREEQWAEPLKQAMWTDTPMIHLCATMWQEEQKEMVQLIKSILRLDLHQSNFCAREAFGMESKDHYKFDANIFFDNAFCGKGPKRTINMYVRRLAMAMQQACREVLSEVDITLESPKKVKTPYGGKLEFTLPNDNKLIVHLKDSKKIRRKKRWSQVMYMYYFLKHGITDNPIYQTEEARMEKAQNTFLLALDGDVDFQPDALRILLDRMKGNPYIGAACGRIHPVGSGPMVWYQKFEYAVSHWLQKASENMLGCVLCSPGCFSLFRGSALMDANVMRSYTKTVSEAAEKIQYDLGEDRWLCTLLLQQGHRVEYCAASDSFTFAPMDFFEFFKQRRRWTPSTMINVLDLIMSWKTTTRNNSDICILYIIYQLGLFASSVVTPGTIFMLIVGAISSSFQAITLTTSFLINLAPLIIFVILCFKTSTKIQLTFALILTICYCLLMTVVLVGIIKQAAESGFCSVSTIFLTLVASIFVISALLHPQEITCLFYGVLYFLLIPSTTLLMVIYSLANLNDVSWGTRDSGESKGAQEKGESKKKMKPAKRLLSRLLRIIDGDDAERPLLEEKQKDKGCPLDKNCKQELSKGKTDLPDKDEIKDICDLLDPYKGVSEELTEEENKFWLSLMSEYLTPIDEKDANLADNLAALRNTSCLGFILINAVFIILLFALESIAQYTPNMAFELPCPDATFKPEKVQPLSIAFIVVFGLLLVVQFVAMLFHRFSTLLQIVAGKEINFGHICKQKGTDSEIQHNDLSRLINDYTNKCSETTTIMTDDERKEDRRRRRDRQSTMKHDLGNKNLWHKMCQIAVKLYKSKVTKSKFSVEDDVKKEFEHLSLMSRKTIESLVKKAVEQVGQKVDDKNMMPFTQTVLTEINKGENQDPREAKTINSVFGLTVYDRERRQRNTILSGGTVRSLGYWSGSTREPSPHTQELNDIEEIKPDYDSSD
ncbi:chitin synthase chs-1-like [Haliotis rufescens]|uniref:chitin synthase chs-1-like n=1 Tax=Haliotis rufescens TaxID=6454 RepID=UPI00201F0AC0|nr:chitin synthase chs-1-like [Haliotis rufescens]